MAKAVARAVAPSEIRDREATRPAGPPVIPESMIRDRAISQGLSVIAVPDQTMLMLLDLAEREGTTVADLVSQALTAFVMARSPKKPDQIYAERCTLPGKET